MVCESGETVVVDFNRDQGGVHFALPCLKGQSRQVPAGRVGALGTYLNDLFLSHPKLQHINRHIFMLSLGDDADCSVRIKSSLLAACSATSNEHVELIPDARFVNEQAYSNLRPIIAKSNTGIEWSTKSNVLHWRGASTGEPTPKRGNDYTKNHRYQLVSMSLDPKYASMLDARFSHLVQGDEETYLEFKQKGLVAEQEKLKEHSSWQNYKYVIDIDGNTNSWGGLFWKLLSNSVVFKVASRGRNGYPYVEWYYDRMKPWEHYIPVKSNLSDLYERYLWATNNDDEARAIAERATELALSITVESERDFVANVLVRSAGLFNHEDIENAYGWNGLREMQVDDCAGNAPVSLCHGKLTVQADAQCKLVKEIKSHFLQYFGPPGLSRDESGKLLMSEKVKNKTCSAFRFAGHHKIPLVISGPVDGFDSRNSKGSKGPALLQQLASIPEDDLIVFTDGMDTFFVAPAEEFVARFFAFEQRLGFSPIIMSTERNCWPRDYSGCEYYPPAPTTFRYANSGGFAGRNNAEFLRFARAWMKCVVHEDDQKCFHFFFMKHPAQANFLDGVPGFANIVLDTGCEIFQTGQATDLTGIHSTLTPKEEYNKPWIVNGEIVNPETNTKPLAIHYNSNGNKMPAHAQLILGDNDDWKSHSVNVWGDTLTLGELCAV